MLCGGRLATGLFPGVEWRCQGLGASGAVTSRPHQLSASAPAAVAQTRHGCLRLYFFVSFNISAFLILIFYQHLCIAVSTRLIPPVTGVTYTITITLLVSNTKPLSGGSECPAQLLDKLLLKV